MARTHRALITSKTASDKGAEFRSAGDSQKKGGFSCDERSNDSHHRSDR